MTQAPAFIAVDWGTSSFRLWAMARDGAVTAERRGDFGMTTLSAEEFEGVLESALGALEIGAGAPVVACGMVGAAQGWRPAPYIDAPARLASLPFKAIRAPAALRDVRILPGVAQRRDGAWDVMRGEETLLLGANVAEDLSGAVCLPGTHSKWADIKDGSLRSFSTAMTGEVYGLLAQRSTLAHSIRNTDAAPGGAFEDAVTEAAQDPAQILRKLFSVRAMPLLMGEAAPDMAARLSGLLIGLEIAGMRRAFSGDVTLIASGVLARNYRRAFAALGVDARLIDADAMARRGLLEAARALWPDLFSHEGNG